MSMLCEKQVVAEQDPSTIIKKVVMKKVREKSLWQKAAEVRKQVQVWPFSCFADPLAPRPRLNQRGPGLCLPPLAGPTQKLTVAHIMETLDLHRAEEACAR